MTSASPMQLLLSGNPNLGTVLNVVYLANETVEGGIQKVHFLDTPDTLGGSDGHLEAERNRRIRGYLPGVRIESTLLSEADMHLEIPRILSGELLTYPRDRLIVDLTNGTKSISNVLYASASLSKIERLFFLQVDRSKHASPPEELDHDDYEVTFLPALDNIGAIGSNSYFEIIYYLDRVDDLAGRFSELTLSNEYLRRNLASQLNHSVRSYFSGEYAASVQNVGQVSEAIAVTLARAISQAAREKIKAKVKSDFGSATNWLRSSFCEPLRGKLGRGEPLDDYETRFRELVNADTILETIRVYRNLASHPHGLLRGQDEAKLVLTNALYLLERILASGAFTAELEVS